MQGPRQPRAPRPAQPAARRAPATVVVALHTPDAPAQVTGRLPVTTTSRGPRPYGDGGAALSVTSPLVSRGLRTAVTSALGATAAAQAGAAAGKGVMATGVNVMTGAPLATHAAGAPSVGSPEQASSVQTSPSASHGVPASA